MTCRGAGPPSCTLTYFPTPTLPPRLDQPSVAFTITTWDVLNWSTAGFVVGKGISLPRNRRCVSVRSLLALSRVSSGPSCRRKRPRIRASCSRRHLQRVVSTLVHYRLILTTQWHDDRSTPSSSEQLGTACEGGGWGKSGAHQNYISTPLER